MKSIYLLIFLIVHLFSFWAYAQYPKGFETYDDTNSSELLYELQKNKREEIKENREENETHLFIYRETIKQLRDYILNKHLLKNDSLDQWIGAIHDSLIDTNPNVKAANKILISRNGLSNAVSYAEGTIIVHLGLLSRIRSEGELAFILAHEMAHYHLGHHLQNVNEFTNKGEMSQIVSRLKKIPSGKMTMEDLQYVQSWFNYMFMNSREQELEADSLALEMVKAAGYGFETVTNALDHLKNIYEPVNPLETKLFDGFIFEEIPFKRRWLQPKRVAYNKSIVENLVNNDSLHSHPDLSKRIDSLTPFSGGSNPAHTSFFQKQFDQRLQFEMISGFEFYRRYDLAIHVALQLRDLYPKYSSYLDFKIGRALHDIALAKNDGRMEFFVSPFTDLYQNESKALNHFFYNLTVAELAEISYLYNTKNFDEANPDHYRVRIANCQLTKRLKELKKFKKEFHNRFPKEKISKYSDTD